MLTPTHAPDTASPNSAIASSAAPPPLPQRQHGTLAWNDVIGDGAHQSLPHLAKLPNEEKKCEFKSLVLVKPRCTDNIVKSMMKHLPKFASGCLNSQVDGHMFFGVVDGQNEKDTQCARECNWIHDHEKLEHGQLVGIRLPIPQQQTAFDWLRGKLKRALDQAFASCPMLRDEGERTDCFSMKVFDLKDADDNRVTGHGIPAFIVRFSVLGSKNRNSKYPGVPRHVCGYHDLKPIDDIDATIVLRNAIAWQIEEQGTGPATDDEHELHPGRLKLLLDLLPDHLDCAKVKVGKVHLERLVHFLQERRRPGARRLGSSIIGAPSALSLACEASEEGNARQNLHTWLYKLYTADPPSRWMMMDHFAWEADAKYAKRLEAETTVITKPPELEQLRRKVLKPLREMLKPCVFDDVTSKHQKQWEVRTRGWALQIVQNWQARTPPQSVLVLQGGPGFGKTALAVQLLESWQGGFYGHFFCRHDQTNKRDPRMLVKTLAYQLAERLPTFADHLLDKQDSINIDNKADALADELLCQPLRAIAKPATPLNSRVLLLIDALDEADAPQGNDALRVVKNYLSNLPEWLGTVVTTRQQVHWMEELPSASISLVHVARPLPCPYPSFLR